MRVDNKTVFAIIFATIFCSGSAFVLPACAMAGESSSTITEATGRACRTKADMNKKVEDAALIDAKKQALSSVHSYLESSSKVTNFILEKDEVDAYSRGAVQVLAKKELGWKKDGKVDCYSVWIRAEVTPDPAFGSEEKRLLWLENPGKPLTVRCWTDKESYKKGEQMRVFLKGNKPFFARLAYRDAGGTLVQLLPNPYRTKSHFQGGVTYEVPAADDHFDLTVSPPFGKERLVLYAGTRPLGDAPLQAGAADAVFTVKTSLEDLGMRTRGMAVTARDDKTPAGPAEFSEFALDINTGL